MKPVPLYLVRLCVYALTLFFILGLGGLARAAVLTPLTVFKNDLADVGPVVSSEDGNQLYAGSITSAEIEVFQRDGAGNLTAPTIYTSATLLPGENLAALTSLAISPDDKQLYVAYIQQGDSPSALIAVFSRDNTGALGLQQKISLPGVGGLNGLRVSPDGAQLYVVAGNSLRVFGRDTQGKLSALQQLNDGEGGVDGLAGAWAIAASADNRFVYVTAKNEHALAVFRRESNGQLVFLAAYKNGVDNINGLGEARGLVLSSDGKHLYVAATGNKAISLFSRDTDTGLLQFSKLYQDGVQGVDGLDGAFALALSPEGSQLYALGSAEHALAVFRRDARSGELTQVSVLREGQGTPLVEGLNTAWGLSAHPGGQQLFVSSPVTDSLAVFKITAADLNLVMQTDADTKIAGERAQLQLIVTNNGAAEATGVVTEYTVPAGVGAVSGGATQGACSEPQDARLRCEIGSLAAGARVTVAIDVDLPKVGSYLNRAVTAADQRDPQPDDNRDEITLSVSTVNQAPVAEADEANTRPGAAVDISVLANDHDPDGDSLSLAALQSPSDKGGVVSANADGSVHYIPTPGFHGLDQFSYTLADSKGATAQAQVRVMVNTPPEARDDVASVTAGATATIFVLVNDSDADGDILSLASVQSPSDKGGVVSANADGSVSYTPAADFKGEDGFTYTVSDGKGGTDTARVELVVALAAAQGASGGTTATGPNQPASQADEGNKKSGGGTLRLLDLLVLSLSLAAVHRRRSKTRMT